MPRQVPIPRRPRIRCFKKTHSLTLTELTAGRMYYFVVRGADRSGNQAVSGEYQVKVQVRAYLPMIRRR